MNRFEAYENSSGGILLYLFDDEDVKKVFEGWECGEKGGLLNAINQLAEDPDAWKSWDGDLVERVGGHYIVDEVDEWSGMVVEEHFQPYTADDFYQGDVDESDLIAFGHFGAFTLYVNEMGASGQFVFGIDD